jgi:23S rRNA (cytidine1920-2'-O)/16S rRNA (cytidine1409-2'-O)-methyltransferase
MPGKLRIDLHMVQRGLAPDQAKAIRMIMAGKVRVADQVILNPSTTFPDTVEISVEPGPRFVSRGGEKLEAALDHFQIVVKHKICADVGASTGGFTDCLLQHGAQKVFAIDVGRGILDWKLRQNPDVVVMEGVNARQVERLPLPVQLVTVDASFISLKTLLPVILGWFRTPGCKTPTPTEPTCTIVALIKPQFEVDRIQADRGKGVIRDSQLHYQVLEEVLEYASSLGFQSKGLIASPLLGPKGNREFLAWLVWPAAETKSLSDMIANAVG